VETWRNLTNSVLYPNQAFIRSVLQGFESGFLPWAIDLTRPGWICENMPSYKKYISFVKDIEEKEIQRNAYSVKFRQPFACLSVSGQGVIMQRNKLRLIHDHSKPVGNSVNDMIPQADKKVTYEGLNDLAKHMRHQHNSLRTPLVWFADVTSAYRHFGLVPEWAIRNGLKFEDEEGTYYRIDNGADFGGAANPRLSCSVFDFVCEIGNKSYRIKVILHYVDDFMGSDVETIKSLDSSHPLIQIGMPVALGQFIIMCDDLGIPLSSLKMGWGDDTIITGIRVNGSDGTFSLPLERIIGYVSYLAAFLKKESCTLHDLDKLSGTLNWCLQVVASGRPFIRPIYMRKRLWLKESRSAIKKIGKEIKEGLRWWIAMLLSNPVRFIYVERWWNSSEADEVILTDASTGFGLGIFIPKRRVAFWYDSKESDGWRTIEGFHINVLEMLAVVCALRIVKIRQYAIEKPKILILSDSGVVCDDISNLDSRSELLLPFVMDLSRIMTEWSWNVRAVHISGVLNVSDDVSRGEEGRRRFSNAWPGVTMVEFNPPSPSSFGLKLRTD
jgi:hypothetical protein